MRCPNWQRHPVEKAAPAPDWTTMSDDEFRKFERGLSSDAYRKLLANQQFVDRVNALPKPKTREQAIADKAAADKEAKLAPHRAIYTNLYFACIDNRHKMPVKSLEEWIALPEATRGSCGERKTSILRASDPLVLHSAHLQGSPTYDAGCFRTRKTNPFFNTDASNMKSQE
jgi:hypothetical protein